VTGGELSIDGRELVAEVVDERVQLTEVVMVRGGRLNVVSTLVIQLGLARGEVSAEFTQCARRIIMVRPINHFSVALLVRPSAYNTGPRAEIADAEFAVAAALPNGRLGDTVVCPKSSARNYRF